MKHDPTFRLAGTTTLGPKGQVVIPADVRESMGIKPGDKLIALHVASKNAVAFISEAQAQTLVDKLGEQVVGLRKSLGNQDPSS